MPAIEFCRFSGRSLSVEGRQEIATTVRSYELVRCPTRALAGEIIILIGRTPRALS